MMNMLDCTTVRARVDELVHGELPAPEAAACRRHVDDCPDCAAALAQAESLRLALQAMPVPEPRAGFAAQALANARHQNAGLAAPSARRAPGRERSSAPRTDGWSWWGGLAAAMAAGLVLAVLWGLPRGLTTAEDPAATAAPLRLALYEPREIGIAIDADQPIHGARLTVRVDGGIELVGFGDTRELSWETDLEQGTNMLALPVLAYSLEQGRLTALVEHQAGRQQIELTLQGEGTPLPERPQEH